MNIQQVFNSSYQNFSYIIYGKNNSCFCIDPFDGVNILNLLDKYNLNLKAIINTHEHFDHTCGNDKIWHKLSVPVWGHDMARSIIPHFSKSLQDGEEISLDDDSYIKVIDTPGHTMAHIGLLIYFNKSPYAVITGDTLFNAGVGNCNSGDPQILYETINDRFLKLDDSVLVYPGHDYLRKNLLFTLSEDPNNETAKKLLNEQKSQGKYKVLSMGVERKINLFLNSKMDDFLLLRRKRDRW